jgi:hypothetical protein
MTLTAVLDALMSAWLWFWELLRRGFDWLREPGNGLKAVCGMLAFACATASLVAFEREQRVLALRQELAEQVEECDLSIAELQAAVAERDRQLDTVARALEAEAERLRQAKAENAAALAALGDRLAQAEQRARLWQQRYDGRPAGCTAAIAALDAACPTLKGY